MSTTLVILDAKESDPFFGMPEIRSASAHEADGNGAGQQNRPWTATKSQDNTNIFPQDEMAVLLRYDPRI